MCDRRLIRAQCVQTLVRRNNPESSYRLKHIKVNLVPALERKIVPVRAPIRAELCLIGRWRQKLSVSVNIHFHIPLCFVTFATLKKIKMVSINGVTVSFGLDTSPLVGI